MKITDLREGSDGEEEVEGWEKVDLWEEAGGSSAWVAVHVGRRVHGRRRRWRGDAPRRGQRGGVLAMGCSGGDTVTRRRGGTRRSPGDGPRRPRGGAGGVGAATSSGRGSVCFELDLGGGRGGKEEDWEEATEGWEVVEASSARGSVLRGFAEGMDIGGGEVTSHARGGWADFAKTCFIAGGARLLFYPALARNAALNRYQPDFHWWDRIDENVVLGAVPFTSQIPQLLQLGVRAVVTLTEHFETLIPTSYYQGHAMDHMEIPTPDYSAAPSIKDICKALHFMHEHASRGDSIYVHCKAGRGRSTTVVLCYLIKYKNMTPEDAWNHTRARRPRVSLTSAQKEAVTRFDKLLQRSDALCESIVLVESSDLMGYNGQMDVSSEKIQPDP